mgnify:CR=1 FL=1
MEKAAFRLDGYYFTKASLDFDIPDKAELNIVFIPRGEFNSKDSTYKLDFDVKVECKDTDKEVISVSCAALFSFNERITISEIPEYFYPNSIAIIFPYIRAFVSTISLLANVRPVVLPTVNLMGLTEKLKERTIVK